MSKIKAPFTPEQVVYLEIYQAGIGIHPFTCLQDHEGDRNLIPTEAGWICPGCSYTQDWCHSFMCVPRVTGSITSWIQGEIAKQELVILKQMYSDWVAAKLITQDANPDIRGLILRQAITILRHQIDHYEFSNPEAPSSKEDPSPAEGDAE